MVDQENFRLCKEVNIRVVHRELFFHKPAKTSRDVMHSHHVSYFVLTDRDTNISGIGECSPIWGLSLENKERFQNALRDLQSTHLLFPEFKSLLDDNPSIRFAIETACGDLRNGGERRIFNPWSPREILINGLVWMNDIESMFEEARLKVEKGFDTIKLKVGALDFQLEMDLLQRIRDEISTSITIRLDANGAFVPQDALRKLDAMAKFDIHSIEQPIKAGQVEALTHIVRHSPIPIALDEELISVVDHDHKIRLLDDIQPNYIILKPTLLGGMSRSDEWIALAEQRNISWWITSALESNIGLNAIAQWTSLKNTTLPQGLGTGELYKNNVPSPMRIDKGRLSWDADANWEISEIANAG